MKISLRKLFEVKNNTTLILRHFDNSSFAESLDVDERIVFHAAKQLEKFVDEIIDGASVEITGE